MIGESACRELFLTRVVFYRIASDAPVLLDETMMRWRRHASTKHLVFSEKAIDKTLNRMPERGQGRVLQQL